MKKYLYILLLLIAWPVFARERIVIPEYVSDTLRINWKPISCSYYSIFKRNFSGEDYLIREFISYKDSSVVLKLLLPTYNYRGAFYVKATIYEKGKPKTKIVSDTLATFLSQERHLFCDTNLDGKVDTTDVELIYRKSIGEFLGSEFYNPKHDVNGDYKIDLVDVSFIYKRILGVEKREIYSTKERYSDYPQGRN